MVRCDERGRFRYLSRTKDMIRRCGENIAAAEVEEVMWQLTYRSTGNMVCHMKTTLNIDETVMQRLREEAARRGTTMSALVEAGLRRVLAPAGSSDGPPDTLAPLPVWKSGGFKVDIANREELYRILDEG